MRKLKHVLIGVAATVVIMFIVAYGTFAIMNWTPPELREPNYFALYKSQDTIPVGKPAVFISGLFLPETFRPAEFYNIMYELMDLVQWPWRYWAAADLGVALLDADRFYEFKPFMPTRLIDVYGSDTDLDGVSYVEKFQRGEVKWVPPDRNTFMSSGYFLFEGRKGGMSTVVAKQIVLARVYYYAKGKGFVDGRMPQEVGERAIVDGAMEKIHAKYGDFPYRFVSALDKGRARQYMRELLDDGADTIILAMPGAIYSHIEEFNGSFKLAFQYIHDWEKENGKKIKVIMSPQLGEFPVVRQAHLQLLKDRLDTLPQGAKVKVVVSIHGMTFDRSPEEAWIQLAPPYRKGMTDDVKSLLASYKFVQTEVAEAQDELADPITDPEGKYLSTNEAFWAGINAGYDYIVQMPIEFFAEGSDTLFSHAMKNFEGFPDYDVYQPIDYLDWSQPYPRTYKVENTIVIYNSVPVGKYNQPVIEAFSEALAAILSKGGDATTSVSSKPEQN